MGNLCDNGSTSTNPTMSAEYNKAIGTLGEGAQELIQDDDMRQVMNKVQEYDQIGDYLIIRRLGEGGFGEVKLGFDMKSRRKVAIKLLIQTGRDPLALQDFQKEIEILSQFKDDHKHVSKLLDSGYKPLINKKKGKSQDRHYYVMECAQAGELFEYISEVGCFSDELSRHFFKQLLNGVKYCHDKGISHRDLKMENLLLDSQFNLKIIDFGLSCKFNKSPESDIYS